MIDFDPTSDAGNAPSPCISICKMNSRTGLCEGCLRTIDEIAQWSSATEEMKRQMWIEIRRRRQESF
ncbi:MAG TPA: DUF1289 domain-containing protein [Noviherbaspirillum sp.]|nr:DUF1289 domain-containing protein [Noviherbaspirillum sp.]